MNGNDIGGAAVPGNVNMKYRIFFIAISVLCGFRGVTEGGQPTGNTITDEQSGLIFSLEKISGRDSLCHGLRFTATNISPTKDILFYVKGKENMIFTQAVIYGSKTVMSAGNDIEDSWGGPKGARKGEAQPFRKAYIHPKTSMSWIMSWKGAFKPAQFPEVKTMAKGFVLASLYFPDANGKEKMGDGKVSRKEINLTFQSAPISKNSLQMEAAEVYLEKIRMPLGGTGEN